VRFEVAHEDVIALSGREPARELERTAAIGAIDFLCHCSNGQLAAWIFDSQSAFRQNQHERCADSSQKSLSDLQDNHNSRMGVG
jgi:hypothetical protein